ncbi:hypothetical protein ABIC66_000185 [Caulobacter sp. 1776]
MESAMLRETTASLAALGQVLLIALVTATTLLSEALRLSPHPGAARSDER